jgi:hypothetical protein
VYQKLRVEVYDWANAGVTASEIQIVATSAAAYSRMRRRINTSSD